MQIYQGMKPFTDVENGLVDAGEEGEGWVIERVASTYIHHSVQNALP